MVEHVMEIVIAAVDRAIVLDLGKVVGRRKPTDVVRIRKSSVPILGIVMLSCMKSPPPIRPSRDLGGEHRVAKGEIVCVAGANGAGKSPC